MAGLEEAEFGDVVVEACSLSLLEYEEKTGKEAERFRVHPLIAEFLRGQCAEAPGLDRMTEWFVERLPEGGPWQEVHDELPALLDWLRRVPDEDLARVNTAGWLFAGTCGPYRAWAELCERGLRATEDEAERSNYLWTLTNVARYGGDMERAEAAAREKQQLDQGRDEERETALASGAIADILSSRGDLDEALRIRREEQLPVYERLGDVRSLAATMGKIADILSSRGDLDEALRTLQEEVLPAFERLGDVRSLLVGRTNLALMLLTRGKKGDREEARGLLALALEAAREMRIPEVGVIEEIMRAAGIEE